MSPAMPLKQETLAECDKTVAALMGEWCAVAHLHSLPWNIAAGLSLMIKPAAGQHHSELYNTNDT